jgi:FAD-linked sulfhydryl oxidase
MDTEIIDACQSLSFCTMTASEMGPSLWKAIHNITRGYTPTPEKKEALKTFLNALAVLIPCHTCAHHFKDIAPTVQVNSKEDAVKWGIDAHNLVNKRLGKPVMTYNEAIQAMSGGLQSQAPTCTPLPDTSNTVMGLSITLGLVVVLLIVATIFAFRRNGKFAKT